VTSKRKKPQDQFDLTLGGHPPLKPRTPKQADYLKAMRSAEMVFGTGPAGTGKTFLAAAFAIEQLVAEEVEQIFISRPALTIEGETHGFLPGTLEKKMEPFTAPVMEAFYARVGKPRTLELLKAQKIRILPFAYMRGVTLANSIVLVDEAQNMTEAQAKALVTRVGEGSTYIINGDLEQSDVGAGNGFQILQRLVRRHEMPIPIIEFQDRDVVRSAMCCMWVEAFRDVI
jgi:phosphate starvation-inducible protein PhoH and related proteins